MHDMPQGRFFKSHINNWNVSQQMTGSEKRGIEMGRILVERPEDVTEEVASELGGSHRENTLL